tara:strand:+ start:331 stop:696 length:366 start_codon:yes stop_codon:yes gene_type:complete
MNDLIHYFESERLMESRSEPLPDKLFKTRTGNITDPDISVHCTKRNPPFRDKVMASRKEERIPWIGVWEAERINGIRDLSPEIPFGYDLLFPLRHRINRLLHFYLMNLPVHDNGGPVIDFT